MVAEFERRAQATPFDSVAHTELGTAYLNKMLTTNGGPEAGKWGAKGGQAYLHALDLDETNWDARFALAQHDTNADMRGDALHNLEALVVQQAERTPVAKHAQSFLWLGNVLMDRGDPQAAMRAWRSGLALFPADESLQERLRAFE